MTKKKTETETTAKTKEKKTNIDKLKDKIKDVGLTLTEERLVGSHYNLTIRKTGRKASNYFTGIIKENATKKECDAMFDTVCDELHVDINAK